eukprot:00117_1
MEMQLVGHPPRALPLLPLFPLDSGVGLSQRQDKKMVELTSTSKEKTAFLPSLLLG